jgi:quercetin dioxygenase-like cupin family protein
MLQNPDIPLELTSFVGREREMADLLRLLVSARLLVVTGTAGCGKTRLALRAAALAGQRYADGVCWVELALLTDPQLVTTWAATRREYQYYLALVRSRLTEEEFRSEPAAGSSLTLEQAIEEAINLPLKNPQAPRFQGLSKRERQVVILIADGKSNWHHHGEYDTYVYTISGKVKLEFGEAGDESCVANAGEVAFIPKNTVHRESNPAKEEQVVFVVRVGKGAPVFNVEGP